MKCTAVSGICCTGTTRIHVPAMVQQRVMRGGTECTQYPLYNCIKYLPDVQELLEYTYLFLFNP